MTDELTDTEFNSTIDEVAQKLVTDLVKSYSGTEITHTEINEIVVEDLHRYWDDYFANYDHSELAGHADRPDFNLKQEVDFTVNAGRIIDRIAYYAVSNYLEKTLMEEKEVVSTIVCIHSVFHHILDVSEEETTPSELVTDFYTWLGAQEDAPPVSLEQFNEMHVRGPDPKPGQVLHFRDSEVVMMISQWLAETYPEVFPENYEYILDHHNVTPA